MIMLINVHEVESRFHINPAGWSGFWVNFILFPLLTGAKWSPLPQFLLILFRKLTWREVVRANQFLELSEVLQVTLLFKLVFNCDLTVFLWTLDCWCHYLIAFFIDRLKWDITILTGFRILILLALAWESLKLSLFSELRTQRTRVRICSCSWTHTLIHVAISVVILYETRHLCFFLFLLLRDFCEEVWFFFWALSFENFFGGNFLNKFRMVVYMGVNDNVNRWWAIT